MSTLPDLVINGTGKLPQIKVDAITGHLVIAGRSIPEDATQFYAPIVEWLDHYKAHPAETTQLTFKLDYFNSGSGKWLLEICRRLETIYYQQKGKVLISWEFEENDSTIEEAGLDFRSMVKVPFEMVCRKPTGENNVERPAGLPLSSSELTEEYKLPKNFSIPIPEQPGDHSKNYDNLLAMSDKLQNRLNQAHEQLHKQAKQIASANLELESQNHQLHETINALTRAKASKKATTIVLFIAVGLFLISEFLEYIVEERTATELNFYWILLIKTGIALSLKPIEKILETRMVRLAENRS